MRQLIELLPALSDVRLVGPGDPPVRKIEFWLDDVGPDDLFVAIPGEPDGHDRVGRAIAAGARTVLCERIPAPASDAVTYLVVPDSIRAMGRLATYYAKKGDAAKAARYIRQGRSLNQTDNRLMYVEGEVKAILGDEPGAVEALKLAFANKYPRAEAQSDPELAKLQQRPDFQLLLK